MGVPGEGVYRPIEGVFVSKETEAARWPSCGKMQYNGLQLSSSTVGIGPLTIFTLGAG